MDNAEIAMVFERHPSHGLRHFLLQQHTELVLEFSRYVHLGQGRTLSRETFRVDAEDVDAAWLVEEIHCLSQRQELALHSKVLHRDRIYHIPLVDFAHVESLKMLLVEMQAV